MASSIIVGNVRQILGRGGFFDPLPPHPSVSSLKKTHPEQIHKVEIFPAEFRRKEQRPQYDEKGVLWKIFIVDSLNLKFASDQEIGLR